MLSKHLFINSDAKANENNVILYKDYRITLLFDRLIRIEKNTFLDKPTCAILFRNFDDVNYKSELLENGIKIDVKGLSYFIFDNFIESYVLINDEKILLDNKENLLSTFEGLDGCDGNVNDHYANPPKPLVLEKGVCSKNGVAVIDDNSSIIDEDGIIKKIDDRFDKYVFAYGHEYQDAVKAFYAISGNVPLIPRYALGNWWSRYHRYHSDEYLALMDKFIEKDIPLTVATIDMDWHPSTNIIDYYKIKELDRMKEEYGFNTSYPQWRWGWTGYSWDKTVFKNPQDTLKKLHRKGLKVTLNTHPDTVCWYETYYDEFVKDLGENPSLLKGYDIDLSNPKFINSYFKNLHKTIENDGVDFWWIDDTTYTFALAHYYYLDNALNHYPLILCRYGGYGSHRYPIGFSGDSVISWKSLDFLPYFTANSSNIGYSWWSHDIGAFMEGYKDDELYLRYVQLGVFLPILRLHSQQNDVLTKEPWAYKNGIGELAIKHLRLRHKLIPFIYSGTYRNTLDGLALIEPMYYYHPEDERSYQFKNQYYFNGQLLVAPITSHSKQKKLSEIKVFLPEGTWTDIFTNDVYEGNKVVNMIRPLDSIPVLAKQGAIYVLGSDGKNSIENPKELEVNVFNGNGSFTLYEDKDMKQLSTTSFDSYNEDNIQYLSIISNDQGAIRKDRTLFINFKNIRKGQVYCNELVKVKNKDNLQVIIKHFDSSKVYEIQVSYENESKLDLLKRQGKESLTYFEGKNVDRVALFNKINEADSVNKYIKVVNEAKLPLIYKKRLKECK